MGSAGSSTPRRFGVGAALTAVLVVAAIAVVVGAVRSAADSPVVVDVPVTATPAVTGTIYVHIAGAVEAPGLYRLEAGARLVDAIALAGGFTDDADPAAVNLARPLSDGEQVHVTAHGETRPEAADGRVSINTSDAAALQRLPGIGPALAARIIAWRTENGPFTSVDDLLAVPGIGEKVLAGLRELAVL
ncbi:helix-hairpin-helix domain-containing protein [Microbacterium sp.]|uniref:helix-hairpin-helix domain-containing protein n=1 Tax=Microbacterium sp. TaxID=51671 RepID=UPI003A895849